MAVVRIILSPEGIILGLDRLLAGWISAGLLTFADSGVGRRGRPGRDKDAPR